VTVGHGLRPTDKAFAQAADSMITQHPQVAGTVPGGALAKVDCPLNFFLTRHPQRNDHDGSSRRAPGFVESALARRSMVVRIYYSPGADCCLSVLGHCRSSHNFVDLVTRGTIWIRENLEDMPEIRKLAVDERFQGAEWAASAGQRSPRGDLFSDN
jgi:xylulose-5-phosphate/fructose-6-phosphate phosphoketolase